jgi:hypothetical protein
MGKWTKRAHEHEHDYPTVTYDIVIVDGDEWTCRCNKVFVVTEARRYAGNSDFGTGKSYTHLSFEEKL